MYITFTCDFIWNHAFEEFLGPLAAIYIGILAIYAVDKEFERWLTTDGKKHPLYCCFNNFGDY